MTGRRRLLIALAAAALILAALAVAAILSGRSLILIENRSGVTLNLSVETTTPGQFSWTGDLPAGGRLIRTARFSDNSLVVVCRDEDGIHRTRGGYVTHGWPHRVDITATGCASVAIKARTIP